MGNWRTIQIIGTIDAAEVQAVKDACQGYQPGKPWQEQVPSGPLTISTGIFGLHNWPAETINRRGNCYERGYSVEDIAEQLALIVEVAPSTNLVIHCGDEYESLRCVATIRVKDRTVSIHAPDVRELPPWDDFEVAGRFWTTICG